MSQLSRRVGTFLLFALIFSATMMLAQENATVSVVGSNIVMPLVEALNQASGEQMMLNAVVTGTTEGITRFCAGAANILVSSRPLSTQEDTNCANNNVTSSEFLLGHNILAFVVNPGLDPVTCLSPTDLTTLFAPSSEGKTTNWNQLNSDYPDAPLSIALPSLDSAEFLILDRLVTGDGVRSDVSTKTSDADIITSVSGTAGSIGVVTLPSAQEAGDAVKILLLDAGDPTGCVEPSAQSVEDRQYGAATRLFLYATTASLENASVKRLLTFIASPDSAAVVEAAGFTAPSADAYQKNQSALENTQGGRQFSEDVVEFQIPQDLTGTISIAGDSSVSVYMHTVTGAFADSYPGVTANYSVSGNPAGIRQLCSGETDIAMTHEDLSPEQADACASANIPVDTIGLGNRAVVLIGNANTEFLSCLTNAQLAIVWNATSASEVSTWNQVDAGFAELKMTLFGPPVGDTDTDLLLTRVTNSPALIREDIETNRDPLYRAAATANVEGALTYMSWSDYQRVLANNQANIQLTAVDTGSGCVQPSIETISDGSYGLTRAAKLLVSRRSLARIDVQSLLMFLGGDDHYNLLEGAGLVGVGFGDLPSLRKELLSLFDQANAQATAILEATPEVTVQAGSETTPEVTPTLSG